jgi:hypothetical protein
MEQDFEIGLKNNKHRSYSRIRYFVILMDLAFFICYTIHEREGAGWLILLLAAVGLTEMASQRGFLKQRMASIVIYGLLAIAWATINWWFTLLHLLLSFLDTISTSALHVSINNEGIIYPSFPEKKIKWEELQNVVLKDGILTIDFMNDTLLQADVDTDNTSPDERVFNQYCREKLK